MGIWVLAGLTFKEAARKKLLWIALGIGLAFLVLFGIAEHYQSFPRTIPTFVQRRIHSIQFLAGLYALNFLILAMTVLTSVDTISGEITSGTIHAVASKPIRRYQLLLGKWLGFVGMMTLFLALIVTGLATVHYWMTNSVPHHLLRGLALIWLECVVLLNLTFLSGTSFSTLTNGVIALGLHGVAFLGGWIEQFGTLTRNTRVSNIGVVASIIMPTEAMWRRAASEMQTPLVGAISAFSPFGGGAIPSGLMVGYAAIYGTVTLVLALRLFGKRDL